MGEMAEMPALFLRWLFARGIGGDCKPDLVGLGNKHLAEAALFGSEIEGGGVRDA